MSVYRIGGTALAIGLVLASAVPPPARAAEPITTRFAIAFDVYWHGLPVIAGTLDGEVDGARYRMRSKTTTQGILAWFVTSQVLSEAAGRLAGGTPPRFRPESYRSRSQWNDDRRAVDMTFGADGAVVAQTAPPPTEEDWDYDRDPVPEALRRGSLDPLSAILQTATRPLDAEPCGWTVPVFDGKRRYDMRFEKLGEETLSHRAITRYRGRTVKCLAHFDRLAGFDTKGRREDDASAPPKPTTVWIVPVHEAGMWLPVKAEANTRWGAVEAIMAPPKIDAGEPVAATQAAAD